ncbi:MAG TPA: DNA polymerase [bacterium]|nr:DNA polymerase [bacterium]
MIRVEGKCANGVLLVGARPPWEVTADARPFTGRSGHAFTQLLLRRDLKREMFALMDYERGDLPSLPQAIKALKPKVVVALSHPTYGSEPFTTLSANPASIDEVRGYVEWSPACGAHLIGTFAPTFIQQGKQNLTGVLLHDIEYGVEVAQKGFIPWIANTLCDPPPFVVEAWIAEYERALAADPARTWLGYDIETPYKAEHEDEGDLEVADPSYSILRIGFAWKEGEALSIPWQAAYLPYIQRLLQARGVKLVWNGRYDNPRLAANGLPVEGTIWDLMWGWHVVNSDLPKGLGFVATFLAKGQQRWKHLAKHEPARYNAIDAEVTRRIATSLVKDLERHHLWPVFDRHIVKLDPCLEAMTAAGLDVDDGARRAMSAELTAELDALTAQMQAVVPLAGKRLKVFKGKPKGVSWVLGDPVPTGFTVKVVPTPTPFCTGCGLEKPPAAHFKVFKKKANPCGGLSTEVRVVDKPCLARVETFVPSNAQMLTYALTCGHKVPMTKPKVGEPKPTFDDLALKELIRRYREDPLYPLVRTYRDKEKLKGTYVGDWDEETQSWRSGPPLGSDGRIHPIFGHNPSTLRLSSSNPNGQNLDARIKVLYVPGEGGRFFEVDYRAIEAVLVGYEAGSPGYVRLAKLGVHDYLNSHILKRNGSIGQAADLSWSDGDLIALFKELKARFKASRDMSKRIVHLSNYGGTPAKIAENYPEEFSSAKEAAFLQGLYFEVCPEIPKWQNATVDRAEDTGYLVNAFGYMHRFWQVKDYRRERDGRWVGRWGLDAKRVLAFLPQSTAAAIIKEALLTLFYDTPWGHVLRLQIHDSILSRIPAEEGVWEAATSAIIEVMTRPIPQLRLPWNPEECLTIDVEAKAGAPGESWGALKDWPLPERAVAA